jgi:hypothetical protein
MERFDAEVRPDLSNAPELLREVPLAIFAAALMWPEKYFPRAHVYLPVPPSNEVQRSWTGSSGELLLETSVAFVQQQLALFSTSGAPLGAGTRLLDFGMGWGRIARLWLKYLPPSQLYGCDAWPQSIALAHECRLQNVVHQSDKTLRELPFPADSFDHIYAMSVFTHLNEAAFRSCFSGIIAMLKLGALFLFSIRPPLFWRWIRPDLEELSTQPGFVFRPGSHDPNFGDTTVDLAWLRRLIRDCGCVLHAFEWSPADAMQVVVAVRKVGESPLPGGESRH